VAWDGRRMADASAGEDAVGATQALRDLAGIVLGDSSFEAVLDRATRVAKRAIAGADDVSATMLRDGDPTTVASSGPLAEAVDERQYDLGHGPCLEAARTARPVLVSDLTTERRWPEYARQALEIGIRSSLSLPLIIDNRSIGAFNSYSRTPGCFDDEEVRRLAEDLAAYAAIVLNNADLYFTATTRADQLAEAMKSRAAIEQAKGILMASRHCTADEAFAILVRLSQQSHRKLREVASTLVQETVGD
jgi:GAF domain-containing protein